MTPSRALRSRVLAEVKKTPSPARAAASRRVAVRVSVGAVAALGLFFLMGGPQVGTRPLELVAFTAGTAALLGVALERLVSPRTGSMLPRPSSQLLAAAVLAAPLLAGVLFVATKIWPSHQHVAREIDIGCGVETLLQGVLPLAVLLLPRRNGDPVHPAISGAALGATAGLLSATFAYVRCPFVAPSHCLIAHVLPTAIFALVGAALGRAFLRVK